jgi:hypothetical protein
MGGGFFNKFADATTRITCSARTDQSALPRQTSAVWRRAMVTQVTFLGQQCWRHSRLLVSFARCQAMMRLSNSNIWAFSARN